MRERGSPSHAKLFFRARKESGRGRVFVVPWRESRRVEGDLPQPLARPPVAVTSVRVDSPLGVWTHGFIVGCEVARGELLGLGGRLGTGNFSSKKSSAAESPRFVVMLHHLCQALDGRPRGKSSAHGCSSRLRLGGIELRFTVILRRCGSSAAHRG